MSAHAKKARFARRARTTLSKTATSYSSASTFNENKVLPPRAFARGGISNYAFGITLPSTPSKEITVEPSLVIVMLCPAVNVIVNSQICPATVDATILLSSGIVTPVPVTVALPVPANDELLPNFILTVMVRLSILVPAVTVIPLPLDVPIKPTPAEYLKLPTLVTE